MWCFLIFTFLFSSLKWKPARMKKNKKKIKFLRIFSLPIQNFEKRISCLNSVSIFTVAVIIKNELCKKFAHAVQTTLSVTVI